MEKISAMPAAPEKQPPQRPELRLIDPDTKPKQKQAHATADLSSDDVEDMWDNMPV